VLTTSLKRTTTTAQEGAKCLYKAVLILMIRFANWIKVYLGLTGQTTIQI